MFGTGSARGRQAIRLAEAPSEPDAGGSPRQLLGEGPESARAARLREDEEMRLAAVMDRRRNDSASRSDLDELLRCRIP